MTRLRSAGPFFLAILPACLVSPESAPAPTTAGDGLTTQAASTLAIDTSKVPLVAACGDGQFVRRVGTTWECAPALTAVGAGFVQLEGCADGQVPRRAGTGWTCATIAEVDEHVPSVQHCGEGQFLRQGHAGWECADASATQQGSLNLAVQDLSIGGTLDVAGTLHAGTTELKNLVVSGTVSLPGFVPTSVTWGSMSGQPSVLAGDGLMGGGVFSESRTLSIKQGGVMRTMLAQDGCTNGQVLKWIDTAWECATDNEGAGGTGGGSVAHATTADTANALISTATGALPAGLTIDAAQVAGTVDNSLKLGGVSAGDYLRSTSTGALPAGLTVLGSQVQGRVEDSTKLAGIAASEYLRAGPLAAPTTLAGSQVIGQVGDSAKLGGVAASAFLQANSSGALPSSLTIGGAQVTGTVGDSAKLGGYPASDYVRASSGGSGGTYQTPVVAVFNTNQARPVAGKTAPVNYDVKEIDTANAVTTGTDWKFVAPRAGFYNVAAAALFDFSAAEGNCWLEIGAIKNGAAGDHVLGFDYTRCFPGVQPGIRGSKVIELAAGDRLQFWISSNVSQKLVAGNGNSNYVSIEWLGPSGAAAGAPTPHWALNLAYNPEGMLRQRIANGASKSSGYGFDQWDVQTASGALTVARENVPGKGHSTAMSFRKQQGTGNFLVQQFLAATETDAVRGEKISVSFNANSTPIFGGLLPTIRFAVVEWAGTADAVTHSSVASYGSSPTYATNYTEVGAYVATLTETEQTFTFTTANTVSATARNLAFIVHTVAPAAEAQELKLTAVMIVKGATPVAYARRPDSIEIEMCEGWYEKSYQLDMQPGTPSALGMLDVLTRPDGNLRTAAPYHTAKRRAPTVTVYSPGTGGVNKCNDENTNADVSCGGDAALNSMRVAGNVGAGGHNLQFQWTSDAAL